MLQGDEIKNQMREACGKCGGENKCIQIVVGKTEGKRPLGRTQCTSENNIKYGSSSIKRGVNYDYNKDK
jgi:positive regulator of sigma E activity